MRGAIFSKSESGSSTAEFAVIAVIFFMVVIGIIEFGRLFYTHNALTDATRRGARYAVLRQKNVACVQNAVVYGETHIDPTTCAPAAGAPALIHGLNASHVSVVYEGTYGLNKGIATVSITDYRFALNIPFVQRNLSMPSYSSTLTAESAGTKPTDISVP